MTKEIVIEMTDEAAAFAAQRDPDEKPPVPRPPPARLTVVERVYHETGGSKITEDAQGYDEVLTSEQPALPLFARVTQGWSMLSNVPLGACSLVTIVNKEDKTAKGAIVEVSFGHPAPAPQKKTTRTQWDADDEGPCDIAADILILPGQSARFRPRDYRRILLRCPDGEARCLVTLYPA